MAGRQTKTKPEPKPRAKAKPKKHKVNPKTQTVFLGVGNAELMRQAQAGKLDLSDWDIEELIRGRRRAKNGTFSGAGPRMVPIQIHDELARRVKTDVAHELRGIASKYIGPILKFVLEHPGGLDPKDVPGLTLQVKAAQDLMDRFVVGRQEKVEVSGTLRHEQIIKDVTIDRTMEIEDGSIEDAVLVDEDED